VLLPFAALRRALPWSKVVADAQAQVELLIEMAADDRARRHRAPRELATALLRFAAARPAAAPSGALGVATADDIPVMARVNRLLQPVPVGRPTRVAATVAVPLIAGVPLLLYALPH
jgi:hypothetical protein